MAGPSVKTPPHDLALHDVLMQRGHPFFQPCTSRFSPRSISITRLDKSRWCGMLFSVIFTKVILLKVLLAFGIGLLILALL
jgi:hypothetical protein